MAKVFLSVLGTGDYVECIYRLDDGVESNPTRYVQEATVGNFCKDWDANDKIIIFTTAQAVTENWHNHPCKGSQNDTAGLREGLKSRLESLGIAPQIHNVMISEGKSVNEIWSIFEVIINNLNPNDEIIFDVTHSFRSIPMLVLVVLNYAKVLKNIKLRGIYYGAFEALGTRNDAMAIPLPERKAPIFNLTPFVELQDWATAIDRFLKAGDATMAAELAKNEADQIKNKLRRRDEKTKALNEIAGTFKDFSLTMLTCRGRKISEDSSSLRNVLAKYEQLDFLPAIRPLMTNLKENMSKFDGDEIGDAVRAAEWCADHNLVPQAYIIMREFMISHVCKLNQIDPWAGPNREEMETRIRGEVKDWTKFKECSKERPPRQIVSKPILHVLDNNENLAVLFNELFQLRNDISHCGIRHQPKSAVKLVNAVKAIIHDAKNIVLRK